jgi:hypothetical protein
MRRALVVGIAEKDGAYLLHLLLEQRLWRLRDYYASALPPISCSLSLGMTGQPTALMIQRREAP